MSPKNIALAAVAVLIVGFVIFNSDDSTNNQASVKDNVQQDNQQDKQVNKKINEPPFGGTKGEAVALSNSQVEIDVQDIEKGGVGYFNTQLPSGKTVYYFIVQDSKGTYRAAANACQVCFDARKGFDLNGTSMVCKNCGNSYPLEKIATEKGGCNPGPINPNLKISNGKTLIKQSELEEVAELF